MTFNLVTWLRSDSKNSTSLYKPSTEIITFSNVKVGTFQESLVLVIIAFMLLNFF